MTISGWSNSTGWPSLIRIFLTTPPLGAVIGFITFIASTIRSVSPAFTASPVLTNGLPPGSPDRNAVPTIGDFTASPEISSWAGAAAGAAWVAAGAVACGAGVTGAPAAYVAAGSRATLIRRSPSSTSISVREFAVRSSASSRTSPGSMRIALSARLLPSLDCGILILPVFSGGRSVRRAARRPPFNGKALIALLSSGSYRAGMDPDDSLSVSIYGEHRRVPGGINLVEMLNELGLDHGRVAVERNLAVVARSTFRETCVEDGDSFEIVHFVGGG